MAEGLCVGWGVAPAGGTIVGLQCAIEQAALSARDAPMDVVSSNAAAIIVYFLNKLFTS